MSWEESRPQVSPVLAGLHCRCPRCGQGGLYRGMLQVADRCPVCGLDLREADSGDGPAVFIVLILGAVVVLLALLLEALAGPPIWLHLLLWPPVILIGAVAMLRPAKALLIALQFKHKARELRHDTGPDHDR